MALEDAPIASAVVLALAAGELARRGYFRNHWFFFILLFDAFLHTVYYHLCWTHSSELCYGRYTDEGARAIALNDDTRSAVAMGLFAGLAAKKMAWDNLSDVNGGAYVYPAYMFTMWALQQVLVRHFSDSLVTLLVLPVLHAVVLTYAFVVRYRSNLTTIWWKVRMVLTILLFVAGVVLRFVNSETQFTNGTTDQLDSYYIMHAIWHALGGAAVLMLVTLLPHDGAESKAVAYAPVKTTAGTVAGTGYRMQSLK